MKHPNHKNLHDIQYCVWAAHTFKKSCGAPPESRHKCWIKVLDVTKRLLGKIIGDLSLSEELTLFF